LQRNLLNDFKRTYRRYDVLLLDDLEFLAGKEKTAEEFFYTFETLMSAGAQTVISSNSHPSELDSLDRRLRERLQSGLVVDIAQPDRQTRLTILKKLVEANETDVSLDVLSHLVDRTNWNVGVLEGALIRIVAFASINESEITVDLASQVLTTLYETDTGPGHATTLAPTVAQIKERTASAVGIAEGELSSSKRSRQVVYARQVAMYLCRELIGLSFPEIGRQFGGRDHTTALHAFHKVKGELLTNSSTRSLVSTLTSSFQLPSTARPQPTQLQ
jgi:chromosomal replication initiator protein